MYLNSHTWLSILAIKSLIFRQNFYPWKVSVNFRLNKCHSHTKILDYFGSFVFFFQGLFFYFGSFLLALIKKVLMKDLKFLLFPTYVPFTLIKLSCVSHKSRYFEIHHEVFIDKVLMKIQKLSFVHFISLKFFETTLKFLLYLNLLGNSYKKKSF